MPISVTNMVISEVSQMVGDPATFGILTVSDRAHSGEYEDEGGPAILGFFEDAVQSEWNHHYKVVPAR